MKTVEQVLAEDARRRELEIEEERLIERRARFDQLFRDIEARLTQIAREKLKLGPHGNA